MIKHRLKGASRALIHDLGGLEAAAKILGLSTSQVGRYQDPRSDDFLSIASAAVLEAQHGVEPCVTQAMAAIGGHILVPRPNVQGTGKWAAHLAATVKEAGDVLSGFGTALANDGEVCTEEAVRLLPEVDQALSALMALRTELERQAGLKPG